MNTKQKSLLIIFGMIAISFAALGTAHAATASGTWYFSPSGLPSGATWSVQIYDVTDGYTVTTVTGSDTLSYTSTAGGAIQLVAKPQLYTQSVSTVDGSYTTSFGQPGGQNMISPTTFTFSYSNTLFYSWHSTGLPTSPAPLTYTISYSDTLGGSYGGTLNGQQNYNNIQIGSSSTSPSLPIGNGYPFSWTVGPPSGYSASPSSGTFTSTGTANIVFSLITYTDTFTESGLPSGTPWGITLSNGTSYKTTGTSLSVNFNIDTQYTYTVQGVAGFSITSGSTGTLQSGSTAITYASITGTDYFSETGLKSGTQWGVYGNNAWHYSTSSTIAVPYNEGTGPWNYTVGNVQYYGTPSPQTGSLNTTSNIAVTYSPITYYNYYNETGLNSGTLWKVVANSKVYSTTTSEIIVPFNAVNQSTWNVPTVSGYLKPSPSNGTLSFTSVSNTISFTKIAGTITYTETGLPTGTSWGMNFNGTQKYASAGSSISFSEPTGTFTSAPSTNDSHWYSPFYNNNQNYLYNFPIALSGVPSGTGYYQQLITITNPSQYGINSAGSNIQFTASNGTMLYAWEQSINSGALQVWVKNYYGNPVIDMQVLPSFENLFSATGYLGYSTTYFNAKYVFPIATDFSGSQLPSGWVVFGNGQYYSNTSSIISVNNGLTITPNASQGGFGILYNTSLGDRIGFWADQKLVTSGTSWDKQGIAITNTSQVNSDIYGHASDLMSWYSSMVGWMDDQGGGASGLGNYIEENSSLSYSPFTIPNGVYSQLGLNLWNTSSYGYLNGNYQTGLSTTYEFSTPNTPTTLVIQTDANAGAYSVKYAFATVNAIMPTASISSYSVAVTGNATYNIQFEQYRVTTHFTATGLDLGTYFYVNATSSNQNVTGIDSSGIDITQANLTNITYFYGVTNGWFTPLNGLDTASTLANSTVTVSFSQDEFAVIILADGLPSGTVWHVYANGREYTSNTNTIIITQAAGSLLFTMTAGSNYTINPNNAWSGFIQSNLTLTFHFVDNHGAPNANQKYLNYMGVAAIITIIVVIAVMAVIMLYAFKHRGGRGK